MRRHAAFTLGSVVRVSAAALIVAAMAPSARTEQFSPELTPISSDDFFTLKVRGRPPLTVPQHIPVENLLVYGRGESRLEGDIDVATFLFRVMARGPASIGPIDMTPPSGDPPRVLPKIAVDAPEPKSGPDLRSEFRRLQSENKPPIVFHVRVVPQEPLQYEPLFVVITATTSRNIEKANVTRRGADGADDLEAAMSSENATLPEGRLDGAPVQEVLIHSEYLAFRTPGTFLIAYDIATRSWTADPLTRLRAKAPQDTAVEDAVWRVEKEIHVRPNAFGERYGAPQIMKCEFGTPATTQPLQIAVRTLGSLNGKDYPPRFEQRLSNRVNTTLVGSFRESDLAEAIWRVRVYPGDRPVTLPPLVIDRIDRAGQLQHSQCAPAEPLTIPAAEKPPPIEAGTDWTLIFTGGLFAAIVVAVVFILRRR